MRGTMADRRVNARGGLSPTLLLVAIVLLTPAVATSEESSWARLGPPGPSASDPIAVVPDWPANRLILANRRDHLIRTRDGGATWERLAAPAESLAGLELAPGHGPDRVAFALVERSPEWVLFQSADSGASWREVLHLRAAPELALSPAFVDDGLALATAGGDLWQTRDAGATWQQLQPAPGQRIAQAVFSPDFAADRTIVLTAVSGGFPGVLTDADAAEDATDHERSQGVLVSTDGGETWSPRAAGLELDGAPYRHVQRLAISPTFPQDGTLLVFAWGPRPRADCVAGGRGRRWHGALFGSADRGLSWEPIRRNDPSCYHTWAELALSPTYAADGVALVGETSAYVTPASNSCSLFRTADRGATWTLTFPSSSYEGCDRLQLVPSGGRALGLVRKKGWHWSQNGGQSWSELSLPSGTFADLQVAGASTGDAFLFAGASHGGVWALGPGVQATDGLLPCPAPLQGGFGRVWQSEPSIRGILGCPTEAEREVRIHERLLDKTRAYLTEDDQKFWFELADTYWSERDKAEKPWPAGPERIVDGAAQRFEGGTMLWLPQPDATRKILVFIQPGHDWREFPD